MLQMPETIQDPPPENDGNFPYLMQFTDGHRIDLTLVPIANAHALENDSLSILLLDKDGLLQSFTAPNDTGYLPQRPSALAFSDCCNEFWWVCPNVAKEVY